MYLTWSTFPSLHALHKGILHLTDIYREKDLARLWTAYPRSHERPPEGSVVYMYPKDEGWRR